LSSSHNAAAVRRAGMSGNGIGVHHERALPIRMSVGFPKPKKEHVVGADLAGRVEAVGKKHDALQTRR